MKINKNILILIVGLVVIGLVTGLALVNRKTKSSSNNPTGNNKVVESVSKVIELSAEVRPHISLIPRADGHELKLKIDKIPSSITQIDYELIYTAKDKSSNLEMEKGVGDTIKEITSNIERDLLLGTASCTNGCKYAYDEGVTGGTLSITFTTNDGQATYQTPFVLKTSADIKKDNGLSLSTENFTIAATTTTKSDYFVLIKNYQNSYSVFSSGNGAGKVTSVAPNTITKPSTTSLLGDYLIQ